MNKMMQDNTIEGTETAIRNSTRLMALMGRTPRYQFHQHTRLLGAMTTALIAAVSGSTLVSAVIWIIVAGLIFWLLSWLIDYAGIGEPFNKVAKVVLALVAVVILINALLTVAGKPFITW